MNRYHIATTILGLIFWLPIYAETESIKGSGYTLTQERKTDSFYNIEVGNHISVYIVQGPFSSITVEADNNLFVLLLKIAEKILKRFIRAVDALANFFGSFKKITVMIFLARKAVIK